MQPYFLPYIGYWQLIGAVDAFVVYDNIKYTKKGWINRNRFLVNGKEALFSLTLRKDSDFLDVNQRYLAESFNREDLINRFREACDHSLKSAERVQAICKALGADTYINPVGGRELYAKENFERQGLALQFLQPRLTEYAQPEETFVPWLSIIDVLMSERIRWVKRVALEDYEII